MTTEEINFAIQAVQGIVEELFRDVEIVVIDGFDELCLIKDIVENVRWEAVNGETVLNPSFGLFSSSEMLWHLC